MTMQIAALVVVVALVVVAIVIGFMNSMAKPAAAHPPGGGGHGGHGHGPLPWYQREFLGIPVAYVVGSLIGVPAINWALGTYTPLNEYQVWMFSILAFVGFSLWYPEDPHKHGATIGDTLKMWVIFMSLAGMINVFLIGWVGTWMDHYPNSLNDVMYRLYVCRLFWVGSLVLLLHGRSRIGDSVVILTACVINIPCAAYVMYGWQNGFLKHLFGPSPSDLVTWLLPM